MRIPPQRLAPDTLAALIESFVLREGSDYGESEVSLQTKTEQVKKQIEMGKVVIVYDADSDSVTLMSAVDYQQRQLSNES